jgi:type I restriction enzyme S subunit
MGKWNKIKLGIACQISKGQQLNKVDLEKAGDYPCINGGVEPSGYTDKWNTEANTITVSEGGNSCGYINFLTTRFWSGGHCYSLLDLKENIDANFLYQALKGRESLIMGLRVGSGLPNIQQKAIKEFEFDYPEEKPEQTRIAQILSKADAAIAQTEDLIAKYQRIKTGLMQDLLTSGIDEHCNIRSKATHRFVVKNGIEVPEEWEVVSLSYFIESLESGVSVNSEDKPAGAGQLGVLKTSALSRCVFIPIQNKIVDANEISRLKCPVRKGAIIISRMNTPDLVGENALVDADYNNLFLPDRLWQTVYRNEDELNVYWLSKILSSKKYRTRISFNASGTSGTMKNITKPDFLSILIPKPSKQEQERISKTLKAISNQENQDLLELQKLQSLKTGLMQDLLTGKVRVKIKEETLVNQ